MFDYGYRIVGKSGIESLLKKCDCGSEPQPVIDRNGVAIQCPHCLFRTRFYCDDTLKLDGISEVFWASGLKSAIQDWNERKTKLD